MPGFSPESLRESNIISSCSATLKALKQSEMDIFYFHGPDCQMPFEEQCRAVDKLYSEGQFERFEVSNLPAHKVLEPGDPFNSSATEGN
jgi:aryl-alcohol dehydrogenase-like predicted oxidoreductase